MNHDLTKITEPNILCDKVGYKTKNEASRAMSALSRRLKTSFRSYKCENCNEFHVTSTKTKNTRRK